MKMIKLRVSDNELKKIKNITEKLNISISEYLRNLIKMDKTSETGDK